MSCSDVTGIRQTNFLGTSLIDYSCGIGWNEQQGQLTANLVFDGCPVADTGSYKIGWDYPGSGALVEFHNPSGDFGFTRPQAGAPTFFKFGDYFTFGGVVQNWIESRSPQGNPTYSVTISDGRELLDACQVVMNGYNGTFTNSLTSLRIDNIFNVYGYYESGTFGLANRTEAGMLWSDIKVALTGLINEHGMWLRNYSYKIDLNGLPDTSGYRFPDTNLSVTELIGRLCQDAGRDYYVSTVLVNGTRTVKVNSVSRTGVPSLTAVSGLVGNGSGFISTSVGRELRNETVSSILTGGPQTAMYTAYLNAANPSSSIWPFWGFQPYDGTIIIGSGVNDAHTFNVNLSNSLPFAGFDNYNITVGELRSSLVSKDMWLTYLAYNNTGIANALGINTNSCPLNINAILKGLNNQVAPPQVWNWNGARQNVVNDWQNDPLTLKKIDIVWNLINTYATEYYGRKFYVRLPNVSAKYDATIGRYFFSYNITDAGWQDLSDLTGGPLGVDATNLELFKEEDGRIRAYVAFGQAEMLDLTELDTTSSCVEQAGSTYNLYSEVSVEPDFIVLPDTSVAAVITLPQAMVWTGYNQSPAYTVPYFFQFLLDRALAMDPSLDENKFKAFMKKAGSTAIQMPTVYAAQIPSGVTIPLQSNIAVYGPFGEVPEDENTRGKVEYEQDDALVPWNYGSISNMTAVANLLSQERVTYMQEGETGSIEAVGAPVISLGDVLIAGGPNVTSINVGTGPQGITTTYEMRTFTPSFGLLAKQNAERMRRIGQQTRKLRRDINLRARPKQPLALGFKNLASNITKTMASPRGILPKTPHTYLVATTVQDTGTNYRLSSVSTLAPGEAVAEFSDWPNKAGMSIDGVLRPFKTGGASGSNFPAFKSLSSVSKHTFAKGGLPSVNPTGFAINCHTLNPFLNFSGNTESVNITGYQHITGIIGGHDIEFAVHGTGLGTGVYASQTYNNEYPTGQYYRAMALRGPLLLAGWGYDINNKPVPNKGTGQDKFADNFLKRYDLWKVGPIDLRWDDNRGVWTSPQNKIFRGTATGANPIFYDQTGGAVLHNDEGTRYNESGVANNNFIYRNMQSNGAIFPETTALFYFDTAQNEIWAIDGGTTCFSGYPNGLVTAGVGSTPNVTIPDGTLTTGTYEITGSKVNFGLLMPLETIAQGTPVVFSYFPKNDNYIAHATRCG